MGDFVDAECVLTALSALGILSIQEMNEVLFTARQIPEGSNGRAKASILRKGLHADAYLTIFQRNGFLWFRTKRMFEREWFELGGLPRTTFDHCKIA